MPKVELKEMHRTIGDLSKQPANIPIGVWKLRAIKISARDVTKTNGEGEEYETKEYTLSMEPIAPGSNVNPDEVNQLDERTGKPVYEGKRLFLRYVEAFRSDMAQLGNALAAMGFDKEEPFVVYDEQKKAFVPGPLITQNKVRGKVAFGEIFNRTYPRNDGGTGTEQKVRSWAAGEGAQAFAL